MKIAIVGSGVSGSSALQAIIDHPNFELTDKIHVFDTRDTLGVGLPYGDDDESVMLNVSPDFISVDPNNPLDFSEWLAKKCAKPTNFEGLVSRVKYGKYLKEKYASYFNHDQVTVFKTEVVDIEVLDKENKMTTYERSKDNYLYKLKTSEGFRDDIYEVVFLAVGHPSYADYYNLNKEENYIGNPYPMKDKLKGFSNDKRIGIIGSGATGVDLMRFFNTNYKLKHPLTYFVRNKSFDFADIPYAKDTFTFTFSKEWIAQQRQENKGNISFELILSTFIKDLKSENVDVKDVYDKYKKGDLETIRRAVESKDQDLALIHAYNTKLVALIPQLYNCLSGQDKDFYLKHYHDKLVFFKTRVPYITFVWLLDLIDQGKLRIIHGLQDVSIKDDGSFYLIADKKEPIDILVNATGFNTKLSEAAKTSALIYNLYQKNIIIPHINESFVLIDWPYAQIINQRFGLMHNLFFFGLLVGGTQHENNDANLTHQLAFRAAESFMNAKEPSK